jgi:hypothetical protein
MASLADRVCETSVTTGTGNFTLAGAVNASYRTFAAGFPSSGTPYYTIVSVDANGNPTGQWECGKSTGYGSSAVLTRSTILSNSDGSTSAVAFTAGTKQVFNAAVTSFLLDASGLTAGTLSTARLPGTVNDAGSLTSGTLSTARLSQTWLTSTSTGQTISGGANVTPTSLTSSTAITADPGKCPLQYITRNGAMSITAPSADGSMVLLITNGATPGAVTFTGFSTGTGSGDSLTTSTGAKFFVHMVRINGASAYQIKALQ